MKFNYTSFNKLICTVLFALTFVNQKVAAQSELAGSGKCLQLDGQDDYLVAGQNNRGITNKITIEAWVKTSSLSLSWVAGKYSNSLGEDAGYEFFVTNGYAALYGRDGSGNYRFSGLSTTFVADNQWHHIAGIVNNGVWEVWVDGNLENKLETHFDKVNLTTEKANFCIGTYQGYNDTYFKGNIDEVRVWNTVRTKDQIRENMCLKLSGTEPNLVGYFKFDEVPGSTGFKDYSTSKINAKIENAIASNILVTSGAPLGDAVKNFYKPNSGGTWATDVAEITEGNYLSFQVAKVSDNVKGVHLYRVESSPNTLSGISGSATLKYYYGVFTVNNSSSSPVTYSVNQVTGNGNDCKALYKRESNAALTWSLLPTRFEPVSNRLTKTNESYRGEYILGNMELAQVSISGKTEICEGSTTDLQAKALNAVKYVWNTGETTSKITVDKPGSYSVKAYLTESCFTETSVTLKVTQPKQVFIQGSTQICPDSPIMLLAEAPGATTYLWSTGERTARIQINSPGNYSVKAYFSEECYSEDFIKVDLNSSMDCRPIMAEVIIPNIITPNGDNLNEVFYIKNLEQNKWLLKIFNRWGNLVYTSNEYKNDWNARGVSDGVYFYVLDSVDNTKKYKGYLEVIK